MATPTNLPDGEEVSQQILFFLCILASLACYVYFVWVYPIQKIRDKKSTRFTKMLFGFLVFVGGICPLGWLLYAGISGSMSGGSASSPSSGGTPPPKAVAPVPNVQPSVVAGAAPANVPVVIQNPAGNVAIGKQN